MYKETSEKQLKVSSALSKFKMETIQNEDSVRALRIVSFGKTGVGKSHTGNTILHDPNAFQTKRSSASVTQRCESVTRTVGRTIKYIDTPGYFDTQRPEEEMRSEILRSIVECAPGPHAFLVLLKVETYTDQEIQIVRKITETFGEDALKYAVVLFTHGDELNDDQTIEDFVRENSKLQELVNKCGGRCHVIDNKRWNQQEDGYKSNRVQIESLMNTIDEMVRENGGGYYTNEMLQEVQRNLMQRIRAAFNGIWSEVQIRAEAVKKVLNKLIVKLAGVATGILLGALLGVIRFVCVVIEKFTTHDVSTNIPRAAVSLLPGTDVAAGVVTAVGAGVLTCVAVAGAARGAQTALAAVEGEQTVLGAMKKAYQACTENEQNEPEKVRKVRLYY